MPLSAPTYVSAATVVSDASSTAQTTPSFTPAANSLLIVTACVGSGGTTPTLSISDSAGLTWTSRGTAAHANGGLNIRTQIWTAQIGASPVAMTVTVTAHAAMVRWTIAVATVTGHDQTTPVPQAGATATGTSSTITATLGSTPAATSLVFGAVGSSEDDGIAQGTGFTEMAYLTAAAGATPLSLDVQYDLASADTTCDWSGLGTIVNAAVAIEIAEDVSSPVTLTVQDATLGVTADSPSLTQANTLAVDEATLSVAAEEPVLTQAHVLAVAEALLGFTAEAPTLTQAHVLAVQDALLSLASDSPALTQAHVLAVAEALLGLTADSPVIGDAVVLVVQDALLVVTADATLLTVVDPSYPGWTGVCTPLRNVGSWDNARIYDDPDVTFDEVEVTFDGGAGLSVRAWDAACRPAAVTILRFAIDEYGELYLSDENFLARSAVVPLVLAAGEIALDDTASAGLAIRRAASEIAAYD